MHLILLPSQTNDTFNVGQDDKRSQNGRKMGVETPKGIFSMLKFFIFTPNSCLNCNQSV